MLKQTTKPDPRDLSAAFDTIDHQIPLQRMIKIFHLF